MMRREIGNLQKFRPLYTKSTILIKSLFCIKNKKKNHIPTDVYREQVCNMCIRSKLQRVIKIIHNDIHKRKRQIEKGNQYCYYNIISTLYVINLAGKNIKITIYTFLLFSILFRYTLYVYTTVYYCYYKYTYSILYGYTLVQLYSACKSIFPYTSIVRVTSTHLPTCTADVNFVFITQFKNVLGAIFTTN